MSNDRQRFIRELKASGEKLRGSMSNIADRVLESKHTKRIIKGVKKSIKRFKAIGENINKIRWTREKINIAAAAGVTILTILGAAAVNSCAKNPEEPSGSSISVSDSNINSDEGGQVSDSDSITKQDDIEDIELLKLKSDFIKEYMKYQEGNLSNTKELENMAQKIIIDTNSSSKELKAEFLEYINEIYGDKNNEKTIIKIGKIGIKNYESGATTGYIRLTTRKPYMMDNEEGIPEEVYIENTEIYPFNMCDGKIIASSILYEQPDNISLAWARTIGPILNNMSEKEIFEYCIIEKENGKLEYSFTNPKFLRFIGEQLLKEINKEQSARSDDGR